MSPSFPQSTPPLAASALCRAFHSFRSWIFLALFSAALPLTAQTIVQEYYVALPEAQIRQNFLSLASNTGTTLDSVVSITVGNPGTRVTYDHWEDGYEIDLNNPTQSSTRIWGDGNNANGIPPGFASDPNGLSAGAVLALRNLVAIPRNAANILFDGRDRIGASNAIVVSRSAWATTPGSVLADATEMSPTVDWGTNFILPVGENIIFPTPLTSSMFERVSLFVQAVETGTQVQIDADANGSFETTVTLNKGEVNFTPSGILRGARVSSNKPVQVHLMTGDIGANYESRWFSIPPTAQWGIRYYAPVGTASNGHEAFGFLHNPNAFSIPITATTRTGSTTFTIPANDTFRYQMPQDSGVDFDSTLDHAFFGVVAVGARPSSNNVYDWGFSLVPSSSLTTALVVGWGPGSSDLSQNGSPVWVTAIANTTLYIDYNGDRAGPVTDPTGQRCDVSLPIQALQSLRVYDPDRDQTAMRLYTLDGTLITGAWGQDPAVAGAGNPFLDVGTTVPAFPAPIMTKTSRIFTDNAPTGLSIGDVIEYTVRLDNKSLVSITSVPVLDTLPPGLNYVLNSTTKDGIPVPDAGVTPFPVDEDGLNVAIVRSREFSEIRFLCTIATGGTKTNVAEVINYPGVVAINTITVPGGGGSTQCALQLTTSTGTPTDYQVGNNVFVTLTDADANTSPSSIQTVQVVITNTSNGDAEFRTLTETGNNTAIFRNTTGLPTSATAGLAPDDGTLNVSVGHTLSSQYLDPQFSDTCSDTATIISPGLIKQLYLDTDGSDNDTTGDLDRVDPVATADTTTSTSQSLATGNSATFTQTPNFVSTFTMPVGGTLATRAFVEVPSGRLPASPAITATVRRNGTAFSTVTTPTTTLISGGFDTLTQGTTTNPAPTNSTNSYSFSHTVPAGNNRLLLVAVALGATASGGDPPTISGVTFNGTAMTLVGTRRSGLGTDGNDDTTSAIYRLIAPPITTANVVVSLSGNGAITAGATNFTNVHQTNPLGTFASAGGYGTAPSVAVTSAIGETVFGTATADEGSALTPGTGVTSLWLRNNYGNSSTSGASGTMVGAATVNFAYTNANTSQDWAIAAVSVRPSFTTAIYRLDWSQTLASTVTANPGDAISLLVQNNVAATPFSLLYDSQTRAGYVSLPTTTVIQTTSVEVYDAPFPAGDLVTSAAIGQTVYVRTAVTDPFGTYDITSLDLNIDGPGSSADITTTLTNPSVVSDNGTVKIYQYTWNTTALEGNYAINATAKEGFENTIQSSRASSFTLTQLDLGTPSTTTFNKDIYAPNETVCVTTIDLDQNLDPAVAETVAVVVTTSSGDSELITLTETGINTGSFTACTPASATVVGGPNNGTLYAPPGTVLTVTYIDPNDPTDTSGDTASVPTPAPSMSVTKTLLSPADGQALVGEPLQYRLRVVNTGSSSLATVSVTDTFNAAQLGYVSAITAPNTVAPGTLTWTNVGPLASGQSTDIIVNFTALASANPAVNSVLADAGGGLTASDTENIIITNPSLSVAKSLVSPNPGPANKGDNVVFSIAIQNTGDTAITSLPLEDTFSGSFFDFVSATPAPDGVGSGSLLWNDLTGAGSLAPGDSTLVSVTLRVLGAANPAQNNAAVLYATDTHGDPVPPRDSNASIQTLAASISGTVYDDIDANDIFSAGDDPLQSITVRLFTDPNSDGDPADGTLVAITNTQADGSYEFLNLDSGTYVVVQEDFIGYVSVDDTQGAPTDNRIAVDVTSFIEYPGNDFLDAFLDTSTYGSISGQVRNDTDADGDLADADAGISGVTIDLYTDPNGDGNISDGVLLITTVTNGTGNYNFPLVPPGSYVIIETDPAGFTSTADTNLPNDNRIPVTLAPSSTSTGNNFLDTNNLSALSTIGNLLWADTNNDGQFNIGESGINGVLVQLYHSTQTPGVDAPYLATTTSGGGLYEFTNVPAGNYVLHIPTSNFTGALLNSTRSSSIANTSDDAIDNDSNGTQSGGPATAVLSPVFNLTAGETDNTKDFGFVPNASLGSISGSVLADTTGNGNGDTALELVQLTLKDSAGNTVATTTTDANGLYSFSNVPPGSYTIEQDQPPTYVSVSDVDGGDLNIIGDQSPIIVTPGATLIDQNFVETQLATISGSVTADLDGDNITDTPLPNVTITLKDNNGDTVATTTTDGTGFYEFIDLPSGSYSIEQTQPSGYTSLTDFDGGNPNLIGSPTLITLLPGDNLTNKFFTEAIFGSISGTVTRDIDNNNSGDLPIGSVTLTLLDSNSDIVATTTTDIDGNYEFPDVPAGNYTVVQTDLPGYQSVTPNSVPTTVIAGQTATVDFVDEQLGTISGTVTRDIDNNNSGDEPLNNVTITLLDNLGATVATTTTDPSGNYTFDDLAPGAYTVVETDLSGYQSVTPNSVPTTVVAGQTATADFVDEQLGTISGTVTRDIDNNNSGDEPLETVTITLLDSLGATVATTTTDATGFYEFTNFAPGNYTVVETDLSGYQSVTPNSLPTTVVAGQTATADFVDEQLGAISGTVTRDIDNNNSGDEPLNNVTITLLDENGATVATTTTDPSGNYTFDDLAPGNYTVVETDLAGYQSVTPNPLPTTVVAGQTATADFVDEQLGAISGTVTRDIDNNNSGDEPLESVTITLLDNNGATVGTTTTDPSGNYTFEDLAPGNYTVVETDLAGYQSVTPNSLPTTVVAGQTATADFVDEQLGAISGTVTRDIDNNNSGDEPLDNVTITLLDNLSATVATTTTDATGFYEFTNLAPGNYTVVETDLSGYQSVTPNSLPTSVVAGQTATADFVDEQFGTISGTVTRDIDNNNSGDEPLNNVSITLLDENGATVATTTTDPSGNYTFEDLAPGNYTVVQTDLAGYQSVTPNSLPTTVVAGQTATADFVDEQFGTISGTVTRDIDNNNSGDEPLETVTITLLDENGATVAATTTDPSGFYEFLNLAPGNYTVVETDLAGYQSVTPNSLPTTVIAGQTATADFVDEQLGAISGTVTRDIDNNNSGDEPLETVTITLLDENGATVATTTTNTSGFYEFLNLAPGSYTVVETDLAGYQSVTPNTLPTSVVAGQTATADFVDEQLGAISGTVTRDIDNNNSGDEPLETVTITLLDENGATVATTTTDPSGNYTFEDLAPGNYTVVQTDLSSYQSVTPNSLPTSVVAGQTATADFVDEQLGTISGTVTRDIDNNDSGDEPLENVTITLLDSLGATIATTTTDPSGNYTFEDLAPGNYTVVQTDLSGYQSVTPNSLPTSVVAGQTATADFVDEQLGAISGTVTRDIDNNNSGDEPLETVTITLLDENGATVATTTTNTSGFYEFLNLAPGSYTVVETDLAGYQSVTPNTLPTSVVAGQTATADFVDEQLGTISGNVTRDIDNNNSGDEPLDNVTITLLDENGATVATTTTDASGFYEFLNLAPGNYTVVETDLSGYQSVTPNSVATAVVAGQTATVDFVDEQLGEISGCVHQDLTGDGNGDAPLSSVTISLQDALGNPIATTTTDSFGIYRFQNIAPGAYIIAQTQPLGFSSIRDEDVTQDTANSPADAANSDPLDDRIPVTLAAGETDDGNDFLERVSSSFIYNAITGELVFGGSVSVSGPGSVILVQDGSTGRYAFQLDPANPVAGTYTLTITPPTGFVIDPTRPVAGPSLDPTSGPNPATLGSAENAGSLIDFTAGANPYYLTFELAPGDPLIVQNNLPVVPAKATTWPVWQYLNPLGGQNQPSDNPDNDRYDNLQEFAFCFNPGTGLKPRCPISVIVDPATGRADVRILRVTGIAGVTYNLEAITTLNASPAGWSDVTSINPVITYNGDGTEWATYQDVASLAPASTSGFFRVRLELDTDLNGSPESVSRTETAGIFSRTFASQCETFSMPFLKCDLFGGSVDSVIGQVLAITSSIGTGNFASALVSGTQYYVEVIGGDHEGHRFEVNEVASTANGIAIDTASALNTLPSLPATLAGDRIAVRSHHRFSEIFPPAHYTATNDPLTADRIQIHSGGSFVSYWLFLAGGTPRWVTQGDSTLADVGNRIMPPAEGMFVRVKNASVSGRYSGLVRSNRMASPLMAGTTFVGGGWPMDQSPTTRAMTTANGFIGSNNPVIADKLQIWKGDSTPNVSGYDGFFLLRAGSLNQWSPEQNASLSNENHTQLLRSLRAAFIRSRAGNPQYLHPLPWTP